MRGIAFGVLDRDGTSLREARLTDAMRLAEVLLADARARAVQARRAQLARLALEEAYVETRAWIERMHTQRDAEVVVLEDAERRIVGYATVGPQRDLRLTGFAGEVGPLHLVPSFALRSGPRLLSAAVWRAVERGLSPVLTWVDEDDRTARRIVSAVGGELIMRRLTRDGADSSMELGYGWTRGLPWPVE
jgi:hypothetical protein